MGMKSLARWITDKYICLLLLVFPLWTGFDGYAQITRWKFIFYAVITVIWAVLLIFFAVRRREKPRCLKVFAALLSALLAWAAVSALASEYGVRTLMGWNYDGLLPMALYAVTALGVAAYGEIKKYYVNLLAVSASICCVVALLQLLGLNPLWLYPEGLDYYDAGIKYAGSFLGTLGNTNILGSFLCICCPLFAFTALFERGRRLWLLLPAALCLAVLVLSRSEAGLLGIAAAALIGVPYYVYLNHKCRAFILTVACEAAIVCAALCVLYQLFGGVFVSLFLEDGSGEAYAVGLEYVHFLAFFYSFIGLKSTTDGLLRGAGDVAAFTIANLVNLSIRVIVTNVFAPIYGIQVAWMAVPLGWAANYLISFSWYLTGKWKKVRVIDR